MAGSSTTATYKPIEGGGVIVDITATADSTTGAFDPIFLDDTANNIAIYKSILGKWLIAGRTTITMGATPTANYDIYILDTATSTSEHLLTTPTLAKGSDVSAVQYAAFSYVINGAAYSIIANTVGIDPGDDIILEDTYGAAAYDIVAAGTISVVEAAANATGYASAALAIAGVPAVATNKARMGYVTAMKSDGAFTFGTTALEVANSTCAYVSTATAYDIAAGRLTNRSATATEQVYMVDSDGAVEYPLISDPLMVVIVNNSVASAIVTLRLVFSNRGG